MGATAPKGNWVAWVDSTSSVRCCACAARVAEHNAVIIWKFILTGMFESFHQLVWTTSGTCTLLIRSHEGGDVLDANAASSLPVFLELIQWEAALKTIKQPWLAEVGSVYMGRKCLWSVTLCKNNDLASNYLQKSRASLSACCCFPLCFIYAFHGLFTHWCKPFCETKTPHGVQLRVALWAKLLRWAGHEPASSAFRLRCHACNPKHPSSSSQVPL